MDMDKIYQTYFTTVYRYIRSISQNESLAEDVTQETFFKAIKKIGQFRGDCDMRVWLCQIAKRTLYESIPKTVENVYYLSEKAFQESNKLDKLEEKGSENEVQEIIDKIKNDSKLIWSDLK